MALVEVARYFDVPEAQVAASAIRASGIPVLVQNEGGVQALGHLLFALGGVRLWVPEADARDVRAFLADRRAQPSRLEPLMPAEAAIWMCLSLLLSLCMGGFAPLRPRRFDRLGDDPAD
ncbi:DUF2007 domain-containing protein [Phenylobacterium aquaticum]|nr:DUF2007 domain-containing protein [Phenylobacterium aquaticum]